MDNNLCNICPRNCNVDRDKTLGFCGASNQIYISKIMLHHYEEPCISGDNEKVNGSGAIFFSSCNLKCIYCQNFQISRRPQGKAYTLNELAEVFKLFES